MIHPRTLTAVTAAGHTWIVVTALVGLIVWRMM